MPAESDLPSADARPCCDAPDPRIARYFDRKMRDRETASELPPMFGTSRLLLAAFGQAAGPGHTVLEVGCGSGALTVALVQAGAVRGDGLDLSTASIEAARRRALAAGVDARVSFEVGDGASASLQPHDWVILDRVLCCYRDVDRLLANALAAAGMCVAFSVPESRGWRGVVNRAFVRLENVTNAVRGRPCPGFVHDIAAIDDLLADAGFQAVHEARTGLWHLAVFGRRGTT